MASTTSGICRQSPSKSEPDFVTVVSVGSQPTIENFVTVLSIGTVDKDDCQAVHDTPNVSNPLDVHPEEQVEVFRLPGEPLGFGLKFEGGAKNAEKVKRLFVQSCAEQSPASRVKCSWGTIGEGDEVLSIDGVPVTHMSRLDCVRRLKESQLVIKLLVRCRGALRPEVVSAELKSPPDSVAKCEKIPPELPSVPPPVPPRKLRQARGFADGEANPIPARKTWNGSPKSSGSSSQTDSPQSQHSLTIGGSASNGKSTPQESLNSSPKSSHGSPSAKRSPELSKNKQEPPEAMVYLDARSQDGSSTHGSTSDDTGSSMSTVVDRFSMSDRFSTVSTTSTTSGGATEQLGTLDRSVEESSDEIRDFRETTRSQTFEHLDQDFHLNSTDYMLKRLANSEAGTHVESRGEAGGVVEKITAVVAPNTVLIEETLTIQPPLSFQDAPLSYGHEKRPDLVYTADLAADSSTHFRPISDEASIVECVNGETGRTSANRESHEISSEAPSLPARNHVNRIAVNQRKPSDTIEDAAIVVNNSPTRSCQVPMPRDSIERSGPLLPPKPLPRKDIKLKRKRPPPPPPPPRREPPPPIPQRGIIDQSTKVLADVTIVDITNGEITTEFRKLENNRVEEKSEIEERTIESINGNCSSMNGLANELVNATDSDASILNEGRRHYDYSPTDSPTKTNDYETSVKTNKVLEIIEMKKIKAFGETTPLRSSSAASQYIDESDDSSTTLSPTRRSIEIVPAPREKKKLSEAKRLSTVSIEDSEDSTIGSNSDTWQEAKERQDSSENATIGNNSESLNGSIAVDRMDDEKTTPVKVLDEQDDDDDDETYRSLDEIKEDFKTNETNGTLSSSEEEEEEEEGTAAAQGEGDSTSDDSEDNGDDYYWQSNLATIGEEEETSSLEYTNANKDVKDSVAKSTTDTDDGKTQVRSAAIEKTEMTNNAAIGDVTKLECVRRIAKEPASTLDKKLETQVNGRMENCEGDQRLPPDGDEFPATYQEFSECTSEQYQYVGTSSRNSQRNGNATTNGAGHVFKETDETSSSTTTTTTKKNAITTSTSREKLSSYVQTTNIQKPLSETRVASQYITSSLKRETFTKQPEVTARDSCLAEDTNEKRTNASYFVSPSVIPRVKKSANNNEQPLVVVSEKTFEISGYYPKETKVIEVEQDYPESVPPPLPLTGPPKIDNASVQAVKSIATDASPVRKYSLNGDLWRQDDKSERSVRDKIAMFSSQSSLEAPLFPTTATTSPVSTFQTTNGRRLSKYKSSEDVFGDEKINETKDQRYNAMERTRSSVDLTDTGKVSVNDEIIVEHYAAHRAPSLPKTLPPDESTYARTSNYPIAKTPPAIYQKPNVNSTTGNSVIIETREFSSSEFNNSGGKSNSAKPAVPSRTGNDSLSSIFTQKTASDKDTLAMDLPVKSPRTIPTALTRATSFSGENKYINDNPLLANSPSPVNNNGQISRTNSLASTFRRNNSEDMRRQSLNQLIEQRRKGISKLRGLVIPEKNAVQIDKPIIDLPEIKSRDSILLHQVPKSSIQDKWGSQSSLASNASSSSSPLKATTSFKMPAPQIMSKYSPAFKRKSLAVYGSSGTSGSSGAKTPPLAARPSTTYNNTSSAPDPPKSLESICSPTRSDYSFEYVSSSSVSPDAMQNNPRPGQRRIRGDYDDSDNDSAVSSSQSSISRGFSPPTSPVPSERSSMSSERSYHTSLIMDMSSRSYPAKETTIRPERNQYLARPGMYNDRAYPSSERSSSCGSSSGSSPNPRSPQPDVNPRNSHIPQRQALKRSSSTETNCSSASSSTLTSGSQTSGESLSRRVLKPQSVEAINRKNILASARCRSGRDLNGSPLIQRKFSDDEELPVSGLAQDNGSSDRSRASNDNSNGTDRQDVKIAYIEITEGFGDDENSHTHSKIVEEIEETKITSTTEQSTNADLLEASNDLKMWVRSEAKALMADLPKSRSEDSPIKVSSSSISETRVSTGRTARSRSSLTLDDPSASSLLDTWNKSGNSESTTETYKYEKNSRFVNDNKETVERSSVSEDLLTTLTTKSRSRAPINLEDRSFSRSSRQMSLEDILVGKTETKLVRTQSVTIESVSEKNNSYAGSPISKQPPTIAPRNNGRSSNESWSEDKSFVSKIPTPGRPSRGTDSVDDSSRLDKMRVSKIPTQRTLGRRSASVTDMKKALEKPESGASTLIGNNQIPSVTGVHQRFSSLDSSVEERKRSVGHDTEADRFNEQFGSISSLASSTSLISQQELAQLVEEASSLEDARGAHDVIVVLLHKENPHGSVGITLAGGVDCEAKEITVHRVLGHSIAEKDGRVQRGDRILSINGRSTRGLNHRESLAVLKQPRSEVVLVVSRSRLEDGSRLRSRTESVETIVEGSEVCGSSDDTAWGPPTRVAIFKDGAGLGFSLAGGRDSPLGDRPLVIKKIFTGGAAEKTAALTAGDQLLEVNGIDVTRMARIEAWSLMKKLSDGEANLLVRHPATKSS